MSSTHLRGQAAVITGGGKNLGALIAKTLAKQGVNIVIHYNSAGSKSETEATLKTVESYGVKAAVFQANLTTEASVEKLFSDARLLLGCPSSILPSIRFDDMFLVNSKCAFFFIKHAANNLNEGGTIISLVTSLLGAFAPGYSTYQGSKAPVEWFTKSAAKELQPKNIRVNCVAPGPMDIPFFYGQETEDAVAFHKSQSLTGRLTDIKDIAPLVEFLCKDKWITGQIIFCKSIYGITIKLCH
ncbi:short-chain dehydrogenase/reductase SDR [Cryptococcus gattii E566]|uniref:Ketoreductase (KR) domain-containing protein n=1 Tax=Cryptococcus gattii serotype B (strain WM276 / ATCC MYA-4071) TaxID=367775 RepID=E6R0U2_CRYGW|nr:uncharacterized protein CGB_B4620W [Cryptococcus gattii WM276]ADV20412.1 Conserved hypothetical protein [Cryptococcus gattii WM276]KIY31536.1 short-chain dehydrogenase/reductase SDR [Cryptococcus gattii E566]